MSYYADDLLTLELGDCVEVMRELPAESVDAVVTDPPYGLEFMGKEWDRIDSQVGAAGGVSAGTRPNHRAPVAPPAARGDVRQPGDATFHKSGSGPHDRSTVRHGYGTPLSVMQAWHEAWAREAFRVAKPGAHLLAFGGTRTYHRLASAIEDAGWEIRDCLVWAYACLSDDTEILTDRGWVRYNSASEASHAAAFDTSTGALRWEPIEAVHQYHHEGAMVRVGPSLVTLNHRVVLSPESQVPLPSHADLRRLQRELRDVGSLPSGAREDVRPSVLEIALGSAEDRAAAALRATQGRVAYLPGVRNEGMALGRLAPQGRDLLLAAVQRESPPARSALPSWHESRLDRGLVAQLQSRHEWTEQPSLEGRGYRVQEAWELLRGALRESPGLGEANGPQGRLRDGAPPTDGGPVRLPANQDGSGEPRESRPDRQPPREPEPLAGQPDPQAVRVGQGDRGHGLSADAPSVVDYAGVVWCITVPSGAFVARRHGVAFVTGNSGFPKSLDVSKAIDKAAQPNVETARRIQVVGELIARHRVALEMTPQQVSMAIVGTPSGACWNWEHQQLPSVEHWPKIKALLIIPDHFDDLLYGDRSRFIAAEREVIGENSRKAGWFTAQDGHDVTAPATPDAAKWDGWGTALKPAWEPIVLARKPLRGTVAANVLAHGTGALNIGATRIGHASEADAASHKANSEPWTRHERGESFLAESKGMHTPGRVTPVVDTSAGRWPANLLLTDAIFDGGVPGVVGGGETTPLPARGIGAYQHGDQDMFLPGSEGSGTQHGDSGTYSRFFKLQEGTGCYLCGRARDAGPSTSPESPPAPGAPSDAPTSPAGTPGSTAPAIPEPPESSPSSTTNGIEQTSWHGDDASTPSTPRSKRRGTSPASTPPSSPARLTDAGSPEIATTTTTAGRWTCDTCAALTTSAITFEPGDTRFLLIPKSSRSDREPLLRGTLADKPAGSLNMRTDSHSVRNGMNTAARANVHPTVKPLDLMRHLVRLVTPPGGTVLDPFLGSGTTAIAANAEGFRAIGIEREKEYLDIAVARLAHQEIGLGLDVAAPVRKRTRDKRLAASQHQPAHGHSGPGAWFTTQGEPDEVPA